MYQPYPYAPYPYPYVGLECVRRRRNCRDKLYDCYPFSVYPGYSPLSLDPCGPAYPPCGYSPYSPCGYPPYPVYNPCRLEKDFADNRLCK